MFVKGCFIPLRSLYELSKFRVVGVNVCQSQSQLVTLWVIKVPNPGRNSVKGCPIPLRSLYELSKFRVVGVNVCQSQSQLVTLWVIKVPNPGKNPLKNIPGKNPLKNIPGRNPVKNNLCLCNNRWQWRESSVGEELRNSNPPIALLMPVYTDVWGNLGETPHVKDTH